MFRVVWEVKAEASLQKLDFSTARKIKFRVETYLIKNPLKLGKPLKNEWRGHYRYRYGDYRVIYQIKNQELIILIVEVDHRKQVY